MDPLTVTITYKGPGETPYQDQYYLHPDRILKETSVNPSKTDDPVEFEQQKVSALRALVRTVRSSS